jgi:hypothetical protein
MASRFADVRFTPNSGHVDIDVRYVGDISQLRQKERPRRGLSEIRAPLEIDIFSDNTLPLTGNTISFTLQLRLGAATWIIEGLPV